MVESIINLELAYINTMHPEFRRDADIGLFFQSDKLNEKKDGNVSEKKPASNIQVQTPPGNEMFQTAIVSSGWFTSFLPIHHVPEKRGNLVAYSIMNPPKPNEKSSQPDLITLQGSVQTGRRLTERDNRECQVIEKLVSNYFNIVRKTIQDIVPKAIMFCLVNSIKENLQRELTEILYKSEEYEDLLEEPESIKIKRDEQKVLLKALEEADTTLNEIREVLL